MDIVKMLNAGFSMFYASTNEQQRAVESISDVIEADGNFAVKVWDCDAYKSDDGDPQSVLDVLVNGQTWQLIIAKNWQWFLVDQMEGVNKGFTQTLLNHEDVFAAFDTRKALVIIGDDSFDKAIPPSLQKSFVEIDFSLPSLEEISDTLDTIEKALEGDEKFKKPSTKTRKALIDSAKGLTAREVANAFTLAAIEGQGKMQPSTVRKLRAKDVGKTPGLKITEPKQGFESLQGYENVKAFVNATIGNKNAKGIMLLGPPGVGKTHLCKCLAKESGLMMFEAEMAELFGGLVGESEKLMKNFLEVVKINAPCILFVDELEKGLAGVGNGQSGDGGTTKRSMAQFLKFLSDDRPEGVYVVATCNNIAQLPPEWVRAERWDCAPFFIDLPNENERKMIYSHYKKAYDVKAGKPFSMEGWSGAEIKSACRIANMMQTNVSDVVGYIVPVAMTMENEISGLKAWAKNRTIPASTPMPPKRLKARRSVTI